MILIKPPCKMPTTIPDSPVLKSPGSSPRIKDECDDFMCIEDSPLDLRINCGRLSPGARDSGTESDDTEEKIIQEGADCKPYKKSLIKRFDKEQNNYLHQLLSRQRTDLQHPSLCDYGRRKSVYPTTTTGTWFLIANSHHHLIFCPSCTTKFVFVRFYPYPAMVAFVCIQLVQMHGADQNEWNRIE
jgi:hypothetical protein